MFYVVIGSIGNNDALCLLHTFVFNLKASSVCAGNKYFLK